MKHITIRALAGAAAISLALGACSGSNPSKPSASEGSAHQTTRTLVSPKETTYALDSTTDVLVDSALSSSDKITRIVKHGDHWHVFTADGREIITYTDPSKARSSAELSNTASVLSADSLQKAATKGVVRIAKHGDHWHVFTADGQEFITYTDPRPYYPNARVENYSGSHGSTTQTAGFAKPAPSTEAPGASNGSASGGAESEGNNSTPGGSNLKPSSPGNGLKVVRVIGKKELSTMKIVRIAKHDDHWHVFQEDGTESITYEDPRALFPNIKVEEYGHSHGDGHTGAPGQKPNKQGDKDKPSSSEEIFSYDEVKAQMIVPLDKLTYGHIAHTSFFDYTRNAFAIAHGDHYHYVTIETIVDFANRWGEFGEYTGRQVVATLKYLIENPSARPKGENGWGSDSDIYEHGNSGSQGGSSSKPSDTENHRGKEVVKIAKHDDHWHLYYADGTESVTYEDPTSVYPNVPVEDYDNPHGHGHGHKGEGGSKPSPAGETFSYDDVKAEMIVPLDKLQYGNITHSTHFDRERNAFVIPHYDHYHYVKLETIVDFADNWGDFGGYTGRQVVATIKYLIENPSARPKGKNGWGSDSDIHKKGNSGSQGQSAAKEETGSAAAVAAESAAAAVTESHIAEKEIDSDDETESAASKDTESDEKEEVSSVAQKTQSAQEVNKDLSQGESSPEIP